MNEVNPVATVCDNEVRIYGSVGPKGRRPLIKVISFKSKGAAIMYAQDHDDREAARQLRHTRPQ